MNRRSFLKGAAVGAATVPFHALLARAQELSPNSGVGRGHTAGYGPLFEAEDRATGLSLLLLPKGFRYVSFGWRGDILASGQATPAAHDGMAAFPAGKGRTRLVRNHEVGAGPPFSGAAYDSQAGGGTTTLEFDTRRGELLGGWDSLSGTIRNCAGGPTPWGSWLTCEETTLHTAGPLGQPHGYVFEVPADGLGSPVPIRDMGRFSHEAVAVDPATGYVYETEDAGSSSGFYRFVPDVSGDVAAGGDLFMLKVKGSSLANLGASYPDGTTFPVDGSRSRRRTIRVRPHRAISCGRRDAHRAPPPSHASRAAGTATTPGSTSSRRAAASARDRSGCTTPPAKRSRSCSNHLTRRFSMRPTTSQSVRAGASCSAKTGAARSSCTA